LRTLLGSGLRSAPWCIRIGPVSSD
jgi:hypothetical protein